MTTRTSGGVRDPEQGHQWLVALASLAVGCAFFALWFWLLPQWLGFHIDAANVAPWQWIALVPSVLGFAVALRCVWDFGWAGHGTPAVFAPPKRLVVVGFYRYVRNPMYLGFITGWLGLWVIFGRVDTGAIFLTIVVVIGVNLFIMFYEEPHLRKIFGAEYEEYCRNVRRWVPRLHAWSK